MQQPCAWQCVRCWNADTYKAWPLPSRATQEKWEDKYTTRNYSKTVKCHLGQNFVGKQEKLLFISFLIFPLKTIQVWKKT